MASLAIKEDLYDRAWGVVEIDFQSYFTTIPHAKLMTLIRQTRGRWESAALDQAEPQGQRRVPRAGRVHHGGRPARVTAVPLYSNIYLNLLDQVWHKRGYPGEVGCHAASLCR